MFAFPWSTNQAIQLVKLKEPWASRYGCQYGPDEWACRFLDRLGEQIRANSFDGKKSVPAIRESIASGHGVGKSALTAWLVTFIMATRPFAQGTVTANTSPQLETKTWAQIAKWSKMSLVSHWFNTTTGRGSMKMSSLTHPDSWFCSAQTCREENSEAFAGQHAANSTSFYIFDESSAVPDKIAEVAEGGLTDGEPMFFKFGNPTRNTGHFHSTFHRYRHRWGNTTIDSRQVQVTNKELLQQWIDDFGEDSDFVRVRVLGKFPKASSLQLIPTDVIHKAQQCEVADQAFQPIIVGVDVARFGEDQSVVYIRRGRDGKHFPIENYRGLDTQQLAAQVLEVIRPFQKQIGAIFVDGGGVGGGVVDRLRALMCPNLFEVNFAGKSSNSRYANKRAEMYGRMKEWLEIGSISDDQDLETDLTSIEYGYNNKNQILLESKENMKKRGMASPDYSDALALTFAEHVGPLGDRQSIHVSSKLKHDYDPYNERNK
jgi:hypothetical protein